MSTKLTSRQLEVLTMIKNTIEQTGIPPTRAEIASALGFRSPNAAEDHIKALTRKGAISVSPGSSRGIRINYNVVAEYFPSSPTSTAHPHDSVTDTSVSKQSNATPIKQAIHKVIHSTRETIRDLRLNLPVVGRVAAGYPISAIENHETSLQLDPSLFASTPDYLLRVKGESMKDVGILDGDLLAVKKTSSVRNGQIVVARIEDEVTVKRFQRQGNTITLLPENSDFSPIIVNSSQEFEIEGIAVGLIRPNTLWH